MFDMTDAEVTSALKTLNQTDENIALTLSLKKMATPKLNWLLMVAKHLESGNIDAVKLALACPWLNPIHDRHTVSSSQQLYSKLISIRLAFEQAQIASNDFHANKDAAE